MFSDFPGDMYFAGIGNEELPFFSFSYSLKSFKDENKDPHESKLSSEASLDPSFILGLDLLLILKFN